MKQNKTADNDFHIMKRYKCKFLNIIKTFQELMQTTYIFVVVHLVSNLREVCLFPNLNTADSRSFLLPVINTVSISTSTRLHRGRFKTVEDDDTY